MTIGTSTLLQLQPLIRALESRQTELTRQAASGQRTEVFGDLGADAKLSIDLRAEIARQESYRGSIAAGQARAGVQFQALSRIGALATQAANDALTLSGTAPGHPGAVATAARAALAEFVAALNTQSAGQHVFAGADATNPPVPGAAGILGSGFVASIAAEVATIGAQPAATVVANTIAIASDRTAGVTIFSAWLETDAPVDPVADPPGGWGAASRGIPAGEGVLVPLDVPANRNFQATSPATPPGTGSYMRDILRGLAVLAQADTLDMSDPEARALMADTAQSLRAAQRTLTADQAAVGVQQRRLDDAATANAALRDALKTRLGAIEEVDIAETLTRLQAVRTQLEASYRLTASLGELSLARFLR